MGFLSGAAMIPKAHGLGSQSKPSAKTLLFFMWGFPKMEVPKNGWFIRDIPIKMDDMGVPYFRNPPYWLRFYFCGCPTSRARQDAVAIFREIHGDMCWKRQATGGTMLPIAHSQGSQSCSLKFEESWIVLDIFYGSWTGRGFFTFSSKLSL